MRILSRYILHEYLIPLFYCLSGFIAIYVLFELFGSFSRLAEAHLPLRTVVRYFIGYLAPFFHYLAPAALMLAALYTMWNFCRHSELIAMRANGVSFWSISAPILSVALVMTIGIYWANEYFVPRHAQWAAQMKNYKFDLSRVAKADDIIFRNSADLRTWTIDRFGSDDGYTLLGVKVAVDRPGGTRLMTINADKAEYLDRRWWFTNAKVQRYDASGMEVPSSAPAFDALPFKTFDDFRERPSDFAMQNRNWQYNSIRDRMHFLRTRNDISPEKRRQYEYDTFARILAPWACLIITLMAIPAGIASGRQSVFRGILGALALFFSFYGVVIGCMVLANLGYLWPIPAAVLPYVIFTAVGIRNFIRNR